MTKRFLTVTVLAGVVGAVPASAQTVATATVLPVIGWNVVPGALYRTANGYAVSVGCKLMTRDAVWGTRNSKVLMQLKLRFLDDQGNRVQVYGSRRGPIDGGGAQFCDLRKGIDSVVFPNITFRDAEHAEYPATPEFVNSLRVVVRYYRASRYSPHTGLDQLNGEFHRFGGDGFIDNVNDNTVSPAATAEEVHDRDW